MCVCVSAQSRGQRRCVTRSVLSSDRVYTECLQASVTDAVSLSASSGRSTLCEEEGRADASAAPDFLKDTDEMLDNIML